MPRGGVRPGAGRPKGAKSPATLDREAALRHFRARVAQHADELFDSQFTLARGYTVLFRKPKQGKAVQVTDLTTIRQYLDGELADAADAYYLVTERPNNFAISDLLDRTFGKAPAALEVTGKDGGPVHVHHHFSA